MDRDVYSTLFEQNASAITQSTVLSFGTASWTHTDLKQQVDLVASALLSFDDLDLEEMITIAKTGKTQWPRALILVKQQDIAEYTVILLACLKVGLEVILIDGSRVHESDYLANALNVVVPQLLFVDESVNPRFYVLDRTIMLKSNSKSSLPTLRSLAELEATKSSILREEISARHRIHLTGMSSYHQPGLAQLYDETNQLIQASHGSIVAGIISCQNLFSRVNLYSSTSFSSTLPLHIVSHLTLSIFCPLYMAMTNYVHSPERSVESLLSSSQKQVITWLTSHQANLLCKRLSKQKASLTAPPSCIAILQPGMGSKSQDILSSYLPGTRLLNVYSPCNSTGLLCLADRTTFGLHLGLPEASHQVSILDKWTGAILPPDQQGIIIVKGPTMMKCFDTENRLTTQTDVAIVRLDGTVQFAYGSSIMDPRTFIEDHIMTHPKINDCSVVILHGHLRAFVSIFKPDFTVVQDIASWAAQSHSYFAEMFGTVSIVKDIARFASGNVDMKMLMSSEILSTSTLVSSGPRMGLFVDHTTQPSTTVASRSVGPPRKAKTVPGLVNKAATRSKGITNVENVQVSSSSLKKPVRDSKRRATHSQIERRRREKINDRLVALRTLVPACAAEIEERKRQKLLEEELRRIAAGELAAKGIRGKRKRNRRKLVKAEDGEKEDELGMHKLEVLTFTIDYIYELQNRIKQLSSDGSISTRMVDKKTAARETDEDEDEEGSDANLEMSDWKPSVKRRPIEFNSRRSTLSSGMSSLAASPAIMSLSAESPMFFAGTLSSTAVFTNLTSPMMSLSSESPILRWSNQSASSSVSNREKERKTSPRKGHFHSTDWQLPDPALPLEDKLGVKARSNQDNSNPTTTADSLENSRGSSTSSSAQEAHLLLSLSTSPEIFRPISAIRKTYNTDSHLQRQRSMTVVNSASKVSSRGNRMGESAPGGAHPSQSSVLISPPLLALDYPSFSVSKSQSPDDMQVDK